MSDYRTSKAVLQLAIFEIQANRGRSRCVEWSARQNTGEKYFIGPKMTPPDPALTLNLT